MNALVKAPLEGEVLPPDALLCVVAAMHPLKNSHELVFMPTGLSVEEIVGRCADQCQVSRLAKGAHVTINGHLIRRELWPRVRVKSGAHVVVRAVPGNGGIFRSILQIALVIVATIVSGPFGSVVGPLVASAIMFVGGLALNALFPPAQTSTAGDTKTVYSIAGTRNSIAKWGPIPVLLGKMRVAPKFAASPYTEFDGDDQYIRLLYVWGQGPIDIGDLKIGETLLSEYEDVEVQTFEGYPTDGQQTLYPAEVVQEDLTIELSRDDGPHLRTSAEDAVEIIVDLVAPNGLVDVDTKSGDKSRFTVSGDIKLRPYGTTEWTIVQAYSLSGKDNDPIRKSFRFQVPEGQYDVEINREQGEQSDDITETVVWTALKSFRKSPPIEYSKPLAITALRIKATKQLNGTPDDLNAIGTSKGRSWNGSEWVADQPTQWPADHFRLVLQGPGNARPVLDTEIDLPTIELWHETCVAKGWKFNMVRDFKSSVRETLRDVCAAGRAVPLFRDGKWSVAWEEDFAPIVQHFTPRNSRDFTWTQAYRRLPHALRIKFVNERKDYIEDERLVYDDGYDKFSATLFEQAEFPGVTDPDLIYKHGRYRIADAHLRPSVYRLTADFESIVCTRGDRVVVAHDVILRGLFYGRVKSVDGQTVTLDEPVYREAGQTYGMRVRRKDGTSVVFAVPAGEGWTDELTLAGTVPEAGNLFMFGYSGQETGAYRILRINRSGNSNLAAELELVDDAPGINNADTGPIVGEPGVVTPPTPVSELRPRNVRASQQIVTRGGAAVHVTRLFFDMPFGLDLASFEVVASDEDGIERRASAPAASPRVEFEDLEPGFWTFLVRGVLKDGRTSRFSNPFTTFINPLDLPAPFVTDLALVNGSTATLFVGTDPEIQWVNNFPAYPAAPSGTNPLFANNILRVYDVLTNALLREDLTTEPRYVYTVAFNRLDNAAAGRSARRLLRFEVAVVDSYGHVSAFVPITVNNPPPALIAAELKPSFDSVFVKWVLPVEPDIAGVAVWLSATSGFNPFATVPAYDGPGTATAIPLPGGVDHYLRIGAYDTFGRQDMNISAEILVRAEELQFDDVAPAAPTAPIVTSGMDTGGRARVSLSWAANTEEDLAGYRVFGREVVGGVPRPWNPLVDTNETRYDALVPPGTVLDFRLQAFDVSGNFSADGPETRHTAAVDTVAPAVPTGITVTNAFETAFLKWTPAPDFDLAFTEIYESTSTVAPTAGTAATFTRSGNIANRGGLTVGTIYYYWLRSADTSGNRSAWSARLTAAPTVISDAALSASFLAATSAFIKSANIIALDAVKITTGFLASDRIQALSIDATKIKLAGTTALSSWIFGSGTTLDGDKVEANTLAANKLTIGQRGLTIDSLVFEHNSPANNQASWSAHTISYVDDLGVTVSRSITAGNATWSTGTLYIYWVKGATTLATSTALATAMGSDRVVLATYKGGFNLVTDVGRTIIDNNGVKTNSLTSIVINVSELTAATAFINALRVNTFTAGFVTAQMLAISDTTNLLENADFSRPISVGWNSPLGTTFPQSASGSGRYEALRQGAPMAALNYMANNAVIPCKPGEKFQLSVAENTSGTGIASNVLSMLVLVQWFNASGGVVSQDFPCQIYGVTTGWVTYTEFLTAPAGAVYLRINLGAGGSASGTFRFSGLHLRRASATLIEPGGITTPMLSAAIVTADKMAAGSVGTLALTVGQSSNLLVNSDFGTGSASGWTTAAGSGNFQGGFSFNLNAAYTLVNSVGSNVAYINQTNNYSGADAGYEFAQDFAARAGQRYETSVYYSAHRCTIELYIAWFDFGGSIVGYTGGLTDIETNMNAASLNDFRRFNIFHTAPANATRGRFVIKKRPTRAGQNDSYLFFTRAFVGEALPNQTEPSSWGATAGTRISGDQIITGRIKDPAGKTIFDLSNGRLEFYD